MLDTAIISLPSDLDEMFIEYLSPATGKSHRLIKPLGMRLLKDGQPGFVAECRLRNELRTFALDRICDARFANGNGTALSGSDLKQLFKADLERLDVHSMAISNALAPGMPAHPWGNWGFADQRRPLQSKMLALSNHLRSMEGASPSIRITLSLYSDRSFIDLSSWVESLLEEASAHERMHLEFLKSDAAKAGKAFLSEAARVKSKALTGRAVYVASSWDATWRRQEFRILRGAHHDGQEAATSPSRTAEIEEDCLAG